MIMADKIMDLRKKNGWSQEELAEKLNVSRQSVSKWEGAQSVPDLNKVIAMASLFDVSTDYLLKDEIENLPEAGEVVVTTSTAEPPARSVSMEEANSFLAVNLQAAKQISIGVVLCILSPICLFMLGVTGYKGLIPLSEEQGSLLGLIILLLMVACAVFLFVRTGFQLSRYSYLEEELIDTEYGVTGMVKERRQAYENTHMTALTAGIILCVLSAVPIFLVGVVNTENDVLGAAGVCLTLVMVAVGVWLIVRVSIIWGGFQKLLEEGDYSRKTKTAPKSIVAGIYWSLAVAVYLAYSFWTNDWERSWIIWPVAGVLFAAVIRIEDAVLNRNNH